MAQVKKCFGDLPEDVVVLSEVVAFDSKGYATVSDEVAEILAHVPGYSVDLEAKNEEVPAGGDPDPENEGTLTVEDVESEKQAPTVEVEVIVPSEVIPKTSKSPAQRRTAASRQ